MTTERPKQLIKYASADAGLEILRSQSLWWSSPNAYTSPFEMNGRCGIAFSSKELLNATVKLATTLIFQDERPQGQTPLISAINRWRDERRFNSPEEARVVLQDLLAKMVAQKEEQVHASLQKWQLFVESVRTCCFSAAADILGNWDKYAEQHQGIAVSITPDSENGLDQMQAVKYTRVRPQLTTLKEQINQLLYNEAVNPSQRFPKNLLTKPEHLSDEREWRALVPKNVSFRKTHDSNRDEKALTPGSIKAVYFGIACDEAKRRAIMAVGKALETPPKFFQMTLAKEQFKLEPVAVE
ncbi:MAG TPA: DUF2971 domain-containing protein [Marinagarivorans sp.]